MPFRVTQTTPESQKRSGFRILDAAGAFLKSAAEEATSALPIVQLPKIARYVSAIHQVRAGDPSAARSISESIRAREAERTAHPIASGLGQVAGMTPAFTLAGKATEAAAKLPQVYRYATSLPGRLALRAGLTGLQGAGAELIQGHPERMLSTGLSAAATGPALSIPNLPLPKNFRLLGGLPRAVATGLSAAGVSAALARPGERTREAAFGGGLGTLTGLLPAYDPLRRTEFDNASVISARARNAGQSLTPEPPPSPQRMEMRRVVADEIYGAGAPVKERNAYLVIGPPAAGKSTLVAEPLAQKTGSLVIDSDAVKAALAKRLGVPLERAGLLHAESSDIAENGLIGRAITAGDNFVLPIVGKTREKLVQMGRELKSQGYKVHLVLSDLPIEQATERAVSRYTSKLAKDPKQARFVDPEYVLSVSDRPQQNYEAIKQLPIWDSYARFSADIPRGEVPRLVEASPGSPVTDLSIFGPSPIGQANLAKVVVSRTREQGGLTINIQGTTPTEGFVVSPYKPLERILEDARFTPEEVAQYLTEQQATLQQAGHSLGTWYNSDDGRFYIDAVVVAPSQDEALALAAQHQQLAIWDVVNKQEIPVHAQTLPGVVRPDEGNGGGIRLPDASGGGEPPVVSGAIPGSAEPPPFSASRAAGVAPPALPSEVHDLRLSQQPLRERLEVAGSQEITRAATRLVQREPDDAVATQQAPRLFRRVAQALREGRIRPEEVPELAATGADEQMLAQWFEEAATTSGQTLNRLSQLWKAIKKNAPETAQAISAEPEAPTTFGRIVGLLDKAQRSIINIWRASLVSQLKTAVRNVATGAQRNLFQGIDDAMSGAWLAATGKRPVGQAFGPAIEDLLALTRAIKPGNRQRVLNLLDSVDTVQTQRLFSSPVSEVTLGGKYANLLGTFNRTQEFFIRTMAADAAIAGELRSRGVRSLQDLDEGAAARVVQQAVDRALELTYARTPTGKIARDMIRTWNQYPILNVLTYPFPRYMANSVKTIWEFSPGGLTKFLSPQYQKILRSGDPRAALSVINKAAIGSAMLAAGWYIRNSEHAGEKWYEVQANGKTYDVRPFGPLLPAYLFLAEALRTGGKGFGPQDWLEGSLGINRMAGTTLFLTSVLAGKNPDALKQKIQEFAGEFLGGFSVPARTFRDLLSAILPEEATVRSTKEAPLTGPFVSNLPGADRSLPPQPSITRPGMVEREDAALGQVTGLSGKTKTFLEAELDRVGLAFYDIRPKTGDPTIDRLITSHIGPAANKVGQLLAKSPQYQAMDDDQKAEILREAYNRLRAAARDVATSRQAGEIAGAIAKRLQGLSTKDRLKKLEGFKKKGLLQPPVVQQLLK